jgi:hypothetical protein
VQIPLDDEMVEWIQVFQRASQEDATPLAGGGWFHDEGLLFIFLEVVDLLSEVCEF